MFTGTVVMWLPLLDTVDRIFAYGSLCYGIMLLSVLSVISSWTKERRVLLVKSFEKKKWVVVRPLPFSRTYPQQYDVSQSFVN